jgi:zinc protease
MTAMRTPLLTAALLLAACKPAATTHPPADTGPVVEPPIDYASVTWPEEPYRASLPAAGPIAELRLPGVETFTLDSGLEVYLVSQQKLPTVTMAFEFDAGGVREPKAKVGMTSICMDLLDEGTKKLDAAAFEEKQADHAVNVSSFGGSDTSGINVRALTSQLGPALDLMAEMLQEPGLRQTDLDRLKDARKASLLQAKGSPAPIAGRLFNPLVWGKDHPYGHIETEKTIDAVTLKDCEKLVAQLKPGGARLWVTGKISQDEIRKELGARLATWKGKAPTAARISAAKPRLGTIFFVHVPGAAQSSVYVGHPGPARAAADYEATDMMVEILGGSFSSRINMNLRENKGYTYGGRAGINYRRTGSSFAASSSVRTDATGPALREIFKELTTMRTSDATPDELRRVQDGALLALPAEFATPSDTLFVFQRLKFYGLPLDWYANYQQRLKTVDIAGVRKAAEKHVRDKEFVVLVVGDGAKILPDLDAIASEKLFGKGGLVILDPDGEKTARPAVTAAPAPAPAPAPAGAPAAGAPAPAAPAPAAPAAGAPAPAPPAPAAKPAGAPAPAPPAAPAAEPGKIAK